MLEEPYKNYICFIILITGMCMTTYRVRVIVFNVTLTHFQQISVISWSSVLLVEETGVPGERHQPVASH